MGIFPFEVEYFAPKGVYAAISGYFRLFSGCCEVMFGNIRG